MEDSIGTPPDDEAELMSDPCSFCGSYWVYQDEDEGICTCCICFEDRGSDEP